MYSKKHILIIGGMGPQASVHAHKKLLEAYQGDTVNSAYPRITHLSINVDDFISDPTQRDVSKRYILDCIKDVSVSSIDDGFIACNTAHLLFDDIQEAVEGKLTSMVEVTKKYVANKKIGLVATPLTVHSNLYGGNIIYPKRKNLDHIEHIIRKVISGSSTESLVHDLEAEMKELRLRGAEKVVLGCSELSMIGSNLDLDYVVDPINLVIDSIVKKK